MNTPTHGFKILTTTAVASLILVACSTAPTRPEGADAVRSKLTQLQSDPQLASRAPVAIKEAEVAVSAAEEPQKDAEIGTHLVLMADRKVDIAAARAQAHLLEDQRRMLGERREEVRLEARTREVDVARRDATSARIDANIARSETAAARNETDVARSETAAADMATEAAWDQADELQRQLFELNAKATDRGLVVTLGDVFFATGKSGIKGNATNNLGKLAIFLNKHPDRTVVIEGHTDSLGSEESNLVLSQQRADSVKSWLASQGIAPARIDAFGKGEGSPVAGNDSDSGRQQNRRVEVIIPNMLAPLNK